MSISIQKLRKLLDKCDFFVNDIFSMNKLCMYIHVVSKKNGHNYIMYIPSKYDINVSNIKSYELKEINNVMNTKDVTFEYGYDKSNKNFEKLYENINRSSNVSEDTLTNNYKKDIQITDVKSKLNEEVKSLYRQINRFKFSVENIKYKLVIKYNSYLCCIDRQNDICFYYIKNYDNSSSYKNLLVSFDIEILYNNHYNIHNEIQEVKDQLESILDNNYKVNLQYIEKLLTSNINISNVQNLITTQLNMLNNEYKTKKQDLVQIINREQEIRDKLKVSKNNNLLIQLKDILTKKGEDIIKLLEIIKRRDNMIVLVDGILFDNIIMLDKITKNMNKLNEI